MRSLFLQCLLLLHFHMPAMFNESLWCLAQVGTPRSRASLMFLNAQNFYEALCDESVKR